MRVQVNLASRPFVELRPFFLRLRLLMAALALAGLAAAIAAHLLSAKAARQQLALDQLRNQTITVQQSKLHTEQRLRDPVNARVLDRAHFLNTLFLRKSFSWTAVMMDLENVLPNGVQVTSIEPQVSPDGRVAIRLRVAGERANAVQLVRNLERSHRFLEPRLAGEASQLKENAANAGRATAGMVPQGPVAPAGVEFDILADYNPLPPGESFPAGRPHASAGGFSGSPGHRGSQPQTIGQETSGTARLPSVGSNRNLRQGYPADGIRLTPYTPPASTASLQPPQRSKGSPR